MGSTWADALTHESPILRCTSGCRTSGHGNHTLALRGNSPAFSGKSAPAQRRTPVCAILPPRPTMSRQLRSRASRPDYAALFQYDDPVNEGAGPSKHPVVEDEVNSGSDFAPEEVQDDEAAEEEDEAMDEDADAEEDVPIQEPSRASPIVVVAKPAAPRIATSKANPMPGLSSKPKNYVLPNANHRHRAIPLFDRPGPVERLIERPSPFGMPRITSTNGWSVRQAVLERISKAWGFNVGQGGLWDLTEDRAWFKESMGTRGEELADERARRPRVHESVRVDGFEVIDIQCVPLTINYIYALCHTTRIRHASSYLPTDVSTTEQGTLRPPPPIVCSFGPYSKQTRLELNMFHARKIGMIIAS